MQTVVKRQGHLPNLWHSDKQHFNRTLEQSHWMERKNSLLHIKVKILSVGGARPSALHLRYLWLHYRNLMFTAFSVSAQQVCMSTQLITRWASGKMERVNLKIESVFGRFVCTGQRLQLFIFCTEFYLAVSLLLDLNQVSPDLIVQTDMDSKHEIYVWS